MNETTVLERMNRHRAKVSRVVDFIKAIQVSGEHYSLGKGNVSHTVPDPSKPQKGQQKIPVRDLTEIIHIDPENRLAVAESGVTFQKLVRETLKYRLVPYCVSELKGITIGGAISGCSVESMSYKYGGFFDSCTELEVITGTGEVLTVSADHGHEIFEMLHGSFGTLGIISLITFKLLPAEPFVRLDYIHFSTLKEYLQAIKTHYRARDVDFMDGIIHSPTDFVLVIGTFVSAAPYTHTYVYNIFYKSTRERVRDYMATEEYFFRYDTECHWCTRNYGLENSLLRMLFGPFVLGSTNILTLATKFGQYLTKSTKPDVVVDLFIPVSKLEEFFSWYLERFNYFPVWIVPYKIEKMYGWVNPEYIKGVSDSLYIDFAIYAFQQPPGENYYKLLEDKLYELQGIKTLISYNYYDEETFWKIHNKVRYERVKHRMDPNGIFKDLYTKTHQKSK
jgi:FAD/FMN-containing dehydrogenase